MIAAVEGYLAVRRLGGFALSNNEYLLRSFVADASAQGEAVVRTASVVAWASLGPSLAQRHRRLGLDTDLRRRLEGIGCDPLRICDVD